jgi:CDGSH-type Zn-finger protein
MSRMVVKHEENGPYLVVVDGKLLASLCSCGLSSRKPLCDHTHEGTRFTAAGASKLEPPIVISRKLERTTPRSVETRNVCKTCGHVNPEWIRNYCVRCAARLKMD